MIETSLLLKFKITNITNVLIVFKQFNCFNPVFIKKTGHVVTFQMISLINLIKRGTPLINCTKRQIRMFTSFYCSIIFCEQS